MHLRAPSYVWNPPYKCMADFSRTMNQTKDIIDAACPWGCFSRRRLIVPAVGNYSRHYCTCQASHLPPQSVTRLPASRSLHCMSTHCLFYSNWLSYFNVSQASAWCKLSCNRLIHPPLCTNDMWCNLGLYVMSILVMNISWYVGRRTCSKNTWFESPPLLR